MKKRIAIGIFIITIGIILLSTPLLLKTYINKSSEKSIEYFDDISYKNIDENDMKEIDINNFDFNIVEEISPTNVLLDPSKINKDFLLGQIVIPSIELNLTIFKGVSRESLSAGVGTMKPEQTMGEGNYSIAGHNTNGALFNKLNEVKENDIVRITDKENIYEYKVYEIKTVNPKDLYMIEDKESIKIGKPIISLMNCEYKNGKNTGKRYFVLGELIDVYKYERERMNEV